MFCNLKVKTTAFETPPFKLGIFVEETLNFDIRRTLYALSQKFTEFTSQPNMKQKSFPRNSKIFWLISPSVKKDKTLCLFHSTTILFRSSTKENSTSEYKINLKRKIWLRKLKCILTKVVKLIDNSWRKHKRNHDREGVCISDTKSSMSSSFEFTIWVNC